MMKETQGNGKWVFDDADEWGFTYRCSHCDRAIMVPSRSHPKPEECPFCNRKMGVGNSECEFQTS